MNLTTAETWRDRHPLKPMPHLACLLVDEIRQIQADALRRGAYRCQTVANIHSNPSLASVAQNLADELNKEANQLHPLPEVKSEPVSSKDVIWNEIPDSEKFKV